MKTEQSENGDFDWNEVNNAMTTCFIPTKVVRTEDYSNRDNVRLEKIRDDIVKVINRC